MVSGSSTARASIRGRLITAVGTVLGVLTAMPRVALACPSCAGNPDGGVMRYLLIGLMVAAPYVAATVVIRFVRKGEAEMRQRDGKEPVARTGYGARVGS